MPICPPSACSFILIEISDTVKDTGKGAVWHMKRAVWVSVAIITTFYFFVSVLGYLAYGQQALYGEPHSRQRVGIDSFLFMYVSSSCPNNLL
jgi:hypothetical protein